MSVFTRQDDLNSLALNRLIAEFGLDARVDSERLKAEFIADNEEHAETLAKWVAMCRENDIRVCTGCGCTEDDACEDPATGRACYWVAPEICSLCADVADALPRVELVTDAQASAFLRDRRADRAAVNA